MYSLLSIISICKCCYISLSVNKLADCYPSNFKWMGVFIESKKASCMVKYEFQQAVLQSNVFIYRFCRCGNVLKFVQIVISALILLTMISFYWQSNIELLNPIGMHAPFVHILSPLPWRIYFINSNADEMCCWHLCQMRVKYCAMGIYCWTESIITKWSMLVMVFYSYFLRMS